MPWSVQRRVDRLRGQLAVDPIRNVPHAALDRAERSDAQSDDGSGQDDPIHCHCTFFGVDESCNVSETFHGLSPYSSSECRGDALEG